jgi:hypothetical protein
MQRHPPCTHERLIEPCPLTDKKSDRREPRPGRLSLRILGLTPDLFDNRAALADDLSLQVPEGGQTLRTNIGPPERRGQP